MSAPMYLASGGVIFQREHVPMTLERARMARAVHLANASYHLAQNDERTLPARLALAKIETALANELEAAIATITQSEQKEAA